MDYRVRSVTVTNRGGGYTAAPGVTFSPAPSGGITATGVAVLATSGNDRFQNLYWARQILSGKTLVVQAGGA